MFKWICILCEKEMEIDPSDHAGSLNPAIWPNIKGGTISMHFGWPSQNDDCNVPHGGHKEWQGCICDNCFEQKQHLLRHVLVVERTRRWVPVKDETEITG
jgi:hypothetical protein